MAWKLRFLALLQLANCYRLFDSPEVLPDYAPLPCREALSRDFDCPFVVRADQVDDFNSVREIVYNGTRASYCADPCRDSLGLFLNNVVVSCGDFKGGLWENMSANSAAEFADSIQRAQGLACLEQDLYPALSSRPATNICEGATYAVEKGDTCESIPKAMSVATDRLIERNGLAHTCSDLLEGGILCIEDPCELVKVEQGQTCEDLVKGKRFSTVQLQTWNPTLKPLCGSRLIPKLDAMAGRYICISPPSELNNRGPSRTQPAKGKWRIEATTPTKLAKATASSEPYKTHLAETDANPDAVDSKAEFLKYCWLTDQSWDYTLDSDGPPEDCQRLMVLYCTFHPEKPSPTAPSSIPETCTPGSSVNEL